MASKFASKALPPPPLRSDKRGKPPCSDQNGASHPWATPVAASSTSSSGAPPKLDAPSEQANASTALSRTPSGRFRTCAASLTKQVKDQGAPQSSAPIQSAPSHPDHKAWQPRWAPKLKRFNPSESVTTYSPILDASLPALPASAASPPPALQLDDTTFGRPFSTSGLFDLDASRVSFLDMSNRQHDSDSDSHDSHGSPAFVQQLPTIQEPPILSKIHVQPPLTPISSDNTGVAEHALASSSLQSESSRSKLTIPPTPSSRLTQDSRSGKASLPASSPALGSLISSFPAPLTRGKPSYAPNPPADSLLAQTTPTKVSMDRLGATAMLKENSWDGGERWDVEGIKHRGASVAHVSTDLPYFDLDDEDDMRPSQSASAEQSIASMQQPSTSSVIAPPSKRPTRNPPPRPAPDMALPELPAKANAAEQATVRRHTRASSVQLGAHRQQESNLSSGGSSRPTQRPLILPVLRSSAGIDRLTAMSPSYVSPSDANGNGLKLLALSRSASTDELARSLDIPRDTVKQMFDTTQHVWRNHLLGSSAFLDEAVPNNSASDTRLSRSNSSPMLSTQFASHDSSEDLSNGSVAKPLAGIASNRSSLLGLPYISSSKLSFQQQNPGWAVSKHSMHAAHPSAPAMQAERAKHRRTFLGRSSEEGLAASYNFSRPIRRDTTGMDPGMAASVSMPSLTAARDAPKPPALLQSPLLLKGDLEATGFAQFAVDNEQETLVDSCTNAHHPFVLSHAPLEQASVDGDHPASVAVSTDRGKLYKPVPAVPPHNRTPSPRLVRRKSDTVLNRFAPEFGKRAPGELHAWSVCIDNDGVPAIRPSPSAFHRPSCALAGKDNATWQCGCRIPTGNDSALATRSCADLQAPSWSSPGRNRSLSAGNALDFGRRAQLWSQVKRNKELIRRHEQKIAGLQEQVARISTEWASVRRPSLSSMATPEPVSSASCPAPPARADVSARNPWLSIASAESRTPPVLSKATPVMTMRTVPLPERVSATGAASSQVQPTAMRVQPRTLRGRIASMSKMNLTRDEENVGPSESHSGHSRLRSSSSTSSLNKLFRFPWSRSSDNKEVAFPQPTPFPMDERNHGKVVSNTSLRDKALPCPQMTGVDAKRPLPAPPASEASLSSKSKRFPPSSRKFSYDMLRGSVFHSSVGSRHLRGRSDSSRSSSFGTSIFSSNDGHEPHETSRFISFPRLGRRWDSISSRGTNASARSSVEVGVQPNVAPFGSMPVACATAGKPVSCLPSDLAARRPETPPHRQSSLLRHSLEAEPPRRTPNPTEYLQASNAVMAPISEQSEMGSPASAQLTATHADFEMSPASVVGASPVGPARMSMSERYRSQGLTVPAPLALSSSLSSPAPRSATLDPDSAIKMGEGAPRASISPHSAKLPIPITVSHGALTVARCASLSSQS